MATSEAPAPQDSGATSLTEWSAREIAGAVRSGRTTARAVLEAHLDVYRANSWMNALAADRFDVARAEADQVDARVAAGDPTLADQPLIGVPLSVKELIAVQGMPHTAGMPHRRRHLADEDAPAVARLRAAGAIVVGVGNSPGPVFWIETNNAFYGRTSSAFGPHLTSGGSSGGEGAGVGSGAVPIALGSDMAGSIRIPAALNGVFGHLPSPGLVPNTGHYPMLEGDFRRLLWLGPLTRRAEDLHLMLGIIAGQHASDPVSRPMSLGDPQSVSIRGLTVAVAQGTTLLPERSHGRASSELAARALESAGAAICEIPFSHVRSAGVAFAAQAIAEADTWEMLQTLATPRRRTGQLLPLVPDAILRLAEAAPVRAVRLLGARRLVDAARRASEEIGEALDGGVLLAAPFPRAAPRHRSTAAQVWLANNTLVFNVLGLPTTQVPLGLTAAGAPRGVQVAGAAGQDHVTLAVACELERALGGWTPPRQA